MKLINSNQDQAVNKRLVVKDGKKTLLSTISGLVSTCVYFPCLILFRKDSLFVDAFRTHAEQSPIRLICLAWSSSSRERGIIIRQIPWAGWSKGMDWKITLFPQPVLAIRIRSSCRVSRWWIASICSWWSWNLKTCASLSRSCGLLIWDDSSISCRSRKDVTLLIFEIRVRVVVYVVCTIRWWRMFSTPKVKNLAKQCLARAILGSVA